MTVRYQSSAFFCNDSTVEVTVTVLVDGSSLEPPFDSKLLQDTSVKGTKAEQTSTTVLNARSRNRSQQDGGKGIELFMASPTENREDPLAYLLIPADLATDSRQGEVSHGTDSKNSELGHTSTENYFGLGTLCSHNSPSATFLGYQLIRQEI